LLVLQKYSLGKTVQTKIRLDIYPFLGGYLLLPCAFFAALSSVEGYSCAMVARSKFFLGMHIGLLLWLGSCRPAPATRSLAFYYWQTSFRLSPTERHYLDSLPCHTLYVKFLDVGRDPDSGEIRPFSQLEVADTTGLTGRHVIPTVFITNNVFQNITADQLDELAQKTSRALQRIGARFPAGCIEPTIQFDCDWTASSRAAFFSFLKKIRPCLPADSRLSATIRLHQFNAPQQTGIPPVERGTLMLYNTGDLDNPAEENSIFQAAAARRFLDNAPSDYPLPLDVALPVFSWALVYRHEELWKIIPDPSPETWADTAHWEAIGPQRFRIRRGTFVGGYYLRPDDRLRVESISPSVLREAARLATRCQLADDATVAFFHLDSAIVARYPVAILQSVWPIFQE